MKYWLLALLLALPLAAQDQKKAENNPPPEPRERKLFILKYADPRQVENLLRPLGVLIQANPELRALAVSAQARDMAGIEDAIKRLDVPSPTPPNIELTAYLITGSDTATSSGALPKELDPVVTQLKNAFPFKSYHLIDTLSLRTRSGDGGNANSVSQPEGLQGTAYDNISIANATLNPDGSSVKIAKLHAGIRVQFGNQMTDLGLSADVDVKEGQKVVVGRLSMGHDQALFLVLTARVAN
ncbi:MAG TPA: secretin N-terminal domain-containing protein [Bryobacteraceae bacterium]|jgi:hypothetical protein